MATLRNAAPALDVDVEVDAVDRFRWYGRTFLASEVGSPGAAAHEAVTAEQRRLAAAPLTPAARLVAFEAFLAERGWLAAAVESYDLVTRQVGEFKAASRRGRRLRT